MFLSFLVPLPGQPESMLINIFSGLIGSTHIMTFPDQKPDFSDLHDILVGYSVPTSASSWEFHTVGGGRIEPTDGSGDPAIAFFADISRTTTDENVGIEDQILANEILADYLRDTITHFFTTSEDLDAIHGSELSPEDTLTLIDDTIAKAVRRMH